MASLVPLPAKARILLIDDDEVDYVITRKQLGQLVDRAYELDWAETFDDGLRALERGRYDVCLVDYRLGEHTGLEFLSVAASLGVSIPMILLTGCGDDEVDARALSLGASAFLDKGRVDARELDRALRYALHREGLVSDLLDHNEELLRLHRLTQIFLRSTSVESRFQAAALEISDGTGFPVVTIERYDPLRETLRCVGIHGMGGRGLGERSLTESPAAEVIRTRRPVVEMAVTRSGAGGDIRHGRYDGRDLDGRGLRVRTFLCLPMATDDVLLGALTLAHPDALPVDSTDLNRAAAVASHLASLMAGIESGRPLAGT